MPQSTNQSPSRKPIHPLLLGAAGAGIVIALFLGGIAVGYQFTGYHHSQAENALEMRGGFRRIGMRGMHPESGEVTKIDGKILTIKSDDGETITVTTDDTTRFRHDQSDAKLSDIKTGDTIAIVGRVSDNKVTARAVIINPDFTPGQ